MNKIGRAMVWVWGAVAVATLLYALWMSANIGVRKAGQYFLFPLVAVAFALMRRFVNARLDRIAQHEAAKKT
jgi:bacteriorhodopsin